MHTGSQIQHPKVLRPRPRVKMIRAMKMESFWQRGQRGQRAIKMEDSFRYIGYTLQNLLISDIFRYIGYTLQNQVCNVVETCQKQKKIKNILNADVVIYIYNHIYIHTDG